VVVVDVFIGSGRTAVKLTPPALSVVVVVLKSAVEVEVVVMGEAEVVVVEEGNPMVKTGMRSEVVDNGPAVSRAVF
jgi:hypothetical protein